MALSEIEKLERRYAENPQGLTFAPLAEVHRKNGDVARALELLRPGLTVHPNYIPASIVLGRCHLDLGDLPAAEAAFAHVLSLDGENVIALKALADITERQFRFDEAERWLQTLLAIDHSNDEARDQLERVEASRRQAGVASSATPDAAEALVLDAEPAPAADAKEPGATPEAGQAEQGSDGTSKREEPAEVVMGFPPLSEPPRDPMLAWAEGSGVAAGTDAAPLELEDLDLGAGNDAAPPEGIEIEQRVTLEEPVEPLSGLVGRSDQEPGSDLHVASDAWQVETADDIVLESSGNSEFQVANAAEELLSTPSWRDREPSFSGRPPAEHEGVASQEPEADRESAAQTHDESTPASPSEPATVAESVEEQPVASTDAASAEAASEPDKVDLAAHEQEVPATAPASSPPSWAPPVAEPPRRSEPDLVVTESMAELLLQQGHTIEALTVFRHLESRTAEDRFRDKVVELERTAASAAAGPAAEPVSGPVPEAAEPTPAFSVQQTHGQSVQAFLRGVLGARPPASSAAAPARAEVARAGSDASAGGAPTRPAHDSLSLSSVFGEESTPTPPAVPAGGSASAGGQGGVSYDEFFGTPGSGPTRAPRSADGKSDDLDQFHAWLQNLKR